MQWYVIPTKQTDNVIIATSNIFWKSIIKNRIIDHFPTGYNTPSITCHSQQQLYTSIIIVRKICFTIVLCVYVMVLYVFPIKWYCSQTYFHSTFKQSIVICKDTRVVMCMHMHTHGHQTMVKEASKTTTFEPISFITHFHIVIVSYSNPIHRYNIFLLASFFRWVKATSEATTLVACFFITQLYID